MNVLPDSVRVLALILCIGGSALAAYPLGTLAAVAVLPIIRSWPPNLEAGTIPIVINEFLASNSGDKYVDPQGEPDDWLELYNRGRRTVRCRRDVPDG